MEEQYIQNLKKAVCQFVEMNDEQIISYIKVLTKITYRKGEFFATPDNPSPYLSFVAKGLFRQYVIDEKGNEVIREFRGDNDFMASYYAIIHNKFPPIYIKSSSWFHFSKFLQNQSSVLHIFPNPPELLYK